MNFALVLKRSTKCENDEMSCGESTAYSSGVVTSLYHHYRRILTTDEKTMKDFHRFSIVPNFSTIFRSWKRDLAIDEETMKDFHR